MLILQDEKRELFSLMTEKISDLIKEVRLGGFNTQFYELNEQICPKV